MHLEVNKNLVRYVSYLFPRLRELPRDWPKIVQLLKGYTPILKCNIVYWEFPNHRVYKCNTDESIKGNPETSSSAF